MKYSRVLKPVLFSSLGLVSLCSAALASAGGGSEGGWPNFGTSAAHGQVVSIESCAWYQPTAVSEHDPLWQCAQVEPSSGADRTIEVVFPGSDDIAWARAPKLSVGEIGTFLLNDQAIPGHLVLIKVSP